MKKRQRSVGFASIAVMSAGLGPSGAGHIPEWQLNSIIIVFTLEIIAVLILPSGNDKDK